MAPDLGSSPRASCAAEPHIERPLTIALDAQAERWRICAGPLVHAVTQSASGSAAESRSQWDHEAVPDDVNRFPIHDRLPDDASDADVANFEETVLGC
jgi:hypothetical protein